MGIDYDRDLMLAFARTHLNAAIALPLFTLAAAVAVALFIDLQVASIWLGVSLFSHWLMVHWARKFVAIDGRTDALQAWRSKFILADLIRGLAWGLLIPVTANWAANSSGIDLFVTLTAVSQATDRVMIGPSVTNPLTRHPAVMASAIASVHELSGGRAMLGIATGDSAIYNINERPRGLQGLREYIVAVRDLLRGLIHEHPLPVIG